jgi:hypothetical protein
MIELGCGSSCAPVQRFFLIFPRSFGIGALRALVQEENSARGMGICDTGSQGILS